jgi:hypothetical protein
MPDPCTTLTVQLTNQLDPVITTIDPLCKVAPLIDETAPEDKARLAIAVLDIIGDSAQQQADAKAQLGREGHP